MMTKLFAITAILIAGILIAAGAYYATANDDSDMTPDDFVVGTRREELLTAQNRIEQQLADLQMQIDKALADQQALNEKVKGLDSKASTVTTKPAAVTTSTVKTPSVPKVTTPTVTQPDPIPVTRAS